MRINSDAGDNTLECGFDLGSTHRRTSMHRDLKSLASNPKLISGIYNYCDRWCERCAFTSRCLVYATLEADASAEELETHDLQSELFWENLAARFEEVRVMILEWADEQGVDLSQIESELSIEEREDRRREIETDDLVLVAKTYALETFSFFGPAATPRDPHFIFESEADELETGEAIDIIKHYQFFIAAKIFRALLAAGIAPAPEEIPENADDELNVEGTDADGSAKIALIAIDRSQAAWHVLHEHLPEESNNVAAAIVQLERLKQMVETAFPNAREFVRPGFDLITSEFSN